MKTQMSKETRDAEFRSNNRKLFNAGLKSVLKAHNCGLPLDKQDDVLYAELFLATRKFSRKVNKVDIRTLTTAVEKSDWLFFDRLSKTLKKPVEPAKRNPTNAEQFFLENWDRVHDFSDSEQLEKASAWLKKQGKSSDAITYDSIKKARQRLGLLKKPSSSESKIPWAAIKKEAKKQRKIFRL
jgi:hypothetical protein